MALCSSSGGPVARTSARPASLSLAILGLTSALAVGGLRAQCATTLQSSSDIPGVDGSVAATVHWDPDGPGPANPLVVLGGRFAAAGPLRVDNIAAFDPATGLWSSFGSGLDGGVLALAVLPNGDLVAAGTFANSGSSAANRIARWTGSIWQPLGGGVTQSSGWVQDLAVTPSGDLIAAGWFQTIGATAAMGVARWDGTAWHSMGNGLNETVSTLTVLPNGDVVAGGTFVMATSPVGNLARWDGVTWSPLGVGVNGTVRDLLLDANGDLVAIGAFTTAGGTLAKNVARWSGLSWAPFGVGLDGSPAVGARLATGQLVVGGTIPSSGGAPRNNLVAWNGATWVDFAGGLPSSGPRTLLELPDGSLIAGGLIETTPEYRNVARWNGTVWSRLGAASSTFAVNGPIHEVLVGSAGDLIAVGGFLAAGGLPIRAIARWNGAQWSSLGSGAFSGLAIFHAVQLPNGDLVVAGDFQSIGGVLANNVARWDGTSWHAMGSGTNRPVLALAVMANGDVVVGGYFSAAGAVAANRVARWNGSAWSALGPGPGTGSSSQVVRALLPLPNGELLAGGVLTLAGGFNIARWNGATWSSSGSMTGGVTTLARRADGTILAGTDFPFSPSLVFSDPIYRFQAGAWVAETAPLTGFRVNSMLELPNGDLLAAGSFSEAGPLAVHNLARWDGTNWSAVGSGIGSLAGTVAVSLAMRQDRVVVGGDFTFAGDHAAGGLAEIVSSCPGSIGAAGNGCPSSGGANILAARTQPWLGTTFRTEATGVPAAGFALVLTGVTSIPQGALPIASLLPQGIVGCDVLVVSDFDSFLFLSGGKATWSTFVPVLPSLLGVTVHQQMVLIDGTAAALGSLTSTNALRITVGVF